METIVSDTSGDKEPEGTNGKASHGEADKVLVKKWGSASIDLGYTVLPAALLRGQARLRINATDLAVLTHLIEHWWRPGEMPWPKKRTIAERLDVSDKTVQRSCARLQEVGLIKRIDRFSKGRRTSNEYDLSPLVERLKVLSEEMAKANKEAKEIKKNATRRGGKLRSAALRAAGGTNE